MPHPPGMPPQLAAAMAAQQMGGAGPQLVLTTPINNIQILSLVAAAVLPTIEAANPAEAANAAVNLAASIILNAVAIGPEFNLRVAQVTRGAKEAATSQQAASALVIPGE